MSCNTEWSLLLYYTVTIVIICVVLAGVIKWLAEYVCLL